MYGAIPRQYTLYHSSIACSTGTAQLSIVLIELLPAAQSAIGTCLHLYEIHILPEQGMGWSQCRPPLLCLILLLQLRAEGGLIRAVNRLPRMEVPEDLVITK